MSDGLTPLRPARARAGMTLVELMLSLSITAMVGLAVAGMLLGLSSGTQRDARERSTLAIDKVAAARLSAAVRGSTMVLAKEPDVLVLWMGDANGNGFPEVAELRRLEREADSRTLHSYRAAFPPDWTQAQIDAVNASYDLTADFAAITAALKSESYFPAEVWTQGVAAWQVALDRASPHQATVLSVRLTLEQGGSGSADASTSVTAFDASLRRPEP